MTTERKSERERERWGGGEEEGKLRTRLIIINNNIGQYTEMPIFFSRVRNTIYYFYFFPAYPVKGTGGFGSHCSRLYIYWNSWSDDEGVTWQEITATSIRGARDGRFGSPFRFRLVVRVRETRGIFKSEIFTHRHFLGGRQNRSGAEERCDVLSRQRSPAGLATGTLFRSGRGQIIWLYSRAVKPPHRPSLVCRVMERFFPFRFATAMQILLNFQRSDL